MDSPLKQNKIRFNFTNRMKLPKNAKLAFEGEIFKVYQWKQKMFDGSHKIFETVVKQDTVVIFATYKNKIVVLKQRQPHTGWFYCTPSGRMDIPGETPKQAAERELLEETGMKSKKLFLWKKITNENDKVKNNVYFFIARDCQLVASQKLDGGEKIIVKLLNFEDFLRLAHLPSKQVNMNETLIDILKAQASKTYKKTFKQAIFGPKP